MQRNLNIRPQRRAVKYRQFFAGNARAVIGTACFVLISGCAGYQVGNQTLFRNSNIRSVHVPIIESESHRRFLGQQLTEAVVKQIEQDTPLKIADAALADSILRCRIFRDRKRQRSLDRFGEPRVLQIGWRVEVDWVDRSGTPLTQRTNLEISDAVEFVPEGGQSMSSAQQALVSRIARQIVGQMETPW